MAAIKGPLAPWRSTAVKAWRAGRGKFALRHDYDIWIVSPLGFEHSDAFYEIAICLEAALKRLSKRAGVVRDPRHIKGCGIVLGASLIPVYGIRELPRNLILFNLEQIQEGAHWITPAYLDLLKSYPVWDYSPNNIKKLGELGIRHVSFCGLGYEPVLTRIKPGEQDIDVLFYGSPNERRDRILNDLESRGVRVVRLFGIYGKKRDAYVARAKILLNIHYYETRIFEVARVMYLLANQKCVISEKGKDHAIESPFQAGVVFEDYDNLVSTCLYYLENRHEREAVAKQGLAAAQARRQTEFLRPLIEK